MSKFADTLVYLRKRDGISQQELADKIDMSRSIVGMYESDQRMPSIEALKTIADTFNVGVDFLIGHVDSGVNSKIFRENLAQIVENSSKADLIAAGINLQNVELLVRGTIPLSFDDACTLADQLGETLDSMLGIEKPATMYGDGLSELIKVYSELCPDNRSKLIELSHLYLSAQNNREEN